MSIPQKEQPLKLGSRGYKLHSECLVYCLGRFFFQGDVVPSRGSRGLTLKVVTPLAYVFGGSL